MSVWKIQSEVWLWDFGLRSIILCHFLSRGDIELPGGRFQHFLISLLLFYLFIFLSSVFLFCSLAQRSLHRVHYSWGFVWIRVMESLETSSPALLSLKGEAGRLNDKLWETWEDVCPSQTHHPSFSRLYSVILPCHWFLSRFTVLSLS